MSNITESQQKKMRHALGLNYKKKPYRNYYYLSTEDQEWNDLAKKGYAVKRPGWNEGSVLYHVTDEGKKLLGVSHE
ncbi:hypothetical protein V3851_04430 [Paenibacillus sp. M1]|uniref:Uncharacterized protein n=1 Tax=Paenibacillus haidiansis TaxID=1574488 RepID=A0ABU7VQ88_9BACL